jgi:4'-phosphopantetheinyl transferase
VLSGYGGAAPAQLHITRGRYGKPGLAAPVLPLAFNLSRSGDWFAMAVSNGAAVGVDLEYCDMGRDVLRLARRFFFPLELAELQACAARERVSRFYDYWTLKEAHIKAGGGALGHELEATGFSLRYPDTAAGRRGIGRIAALAPVASAWYGLLQPVADYRLALCCRSPRALACGVRLFERSEGAPIERRFALRAVSLLPGSTPEAA